MKIIWAPWRIKYILGNKGKECIFCRAVKSKDDKNNYVLYRSSKTFVVLNKFPYNNGHIMIAPYKHCADFECLNSEELLDMGEIQKKFTAMIKQVMNPNGFNIGMNVGKSAGAGVADHIHIHIVPRWDGDTNFMPLIGKTKILPESLDSVYDKFKKALD